MHRLLIIISLELLLLRCRFLRGTRMATAHDLPTVLFVGLVHYRDASTATIEETTVTMEESGLATNNSSISQWK